MHFFPTLCLQSLLRYQDPAESNRMLFRDLQDSVKELQGLHLRIPLKACFQSFW